MKIKFVITAVLTGWLALSGSSLWADKPGGPGKTAGEAGWNLQQLKTELGLSDLQVANLEKINAAQRDAMKSLSLRQRDLMKKLEEQVKAKASEAEIETTLKELKSVRHAMRDQMEQFQNQKEDILTPTQRAQMLLRWRDHRSDRREMWKEKRKEQ